MLTLGIETSCDETAVAVVKDDSVVLSSVVASQAARHAPFGGVVPEIAAREHVTALVPVLDRALSEAGCERSDITLIAVTERPGLVSALLSGVAAAQALGVARNSNKTVAPSLSMATRLKCSPASAQVMSPV